MQTLIIILELMQLEYYITGYALLHCSNLVVFTLSFRPSRGADAGQQKLVTVRSHIGLLRITVLQYQNSGRLERSASVRRVSRLLGTVRADCPVTSHHSRAPRWCDASVLRPCRLMIKNKNKKSDSVNPAG